MTPLAGTWQPGHADPDDSGGGEIHRAQRRALRHPALSRPRWRCAHFNRPSLRVSARINMRFPAESQREARRSCQLGVVSLEGTRGIQGADPVVIDALAGDDLDSQVTEAG